MRPHIPYYDPAKEDWTEILGTGVTRKVLGTDPETGGDTCYVNIPKGWEGIAGALVCKDCRVSTGCNLSDCSVPADHRRNWQVNRSIEAKASIPKVDGKKCQFIIQLSGF